jgi:surfactin synthase thioesterase subunit
MSTGTAKAPVSRYGPWLTVSGERPGSLLVLILPFAGGGRSFYSGWDRYFAPWASLCYVNLPGREQRFREDPIAAADVLIPPLANACAELVDGRPYAIFGHSMGALLGYETACALLDKGLPPPVHLVVSGLCSPDTPLPGKPLADVTDEELLAELEKIMELDGSSGPVTGLVAAMLPTARADFTLCERYTWRPRPPLDTGITALWSADDPLTTSSGVAAWGRHTACGFRSLRFRGPHFFIREHGATVASQLSAYAPVAATAGRGGRS